MSTPSSSPAGGNRPRTRSVSSVNSTDSTGGNNNTPTRVSKRQAAMAAIKEITQGEQNDDADVMAHNSSSEGEDDDDDDDDDDDASDDETEQVNDATSEGNESENQDSNDNNDGDKQDEVEEEEKEAGLTELVDEEPDKHPEPFSGLSVQTKTKKLRTTTTTRTSVAAATSFDLLSLIRPRHAAPITAATYSAASASSFKPSGSRWRVTPHAQSQQRSSAAKMVALEAKRTAPTKLQVGAGSKLFSFDSGFKAGKGSAQIASSAREALVASSIKQVGRGKVGSDLQRIKHDWFKMNTPELTDSVRNDLRAVQLRAYMNPKKFYKSSNRKGGVLPTEFEIGTVKEGLGEFKSARLLKKDQQQTFMDEVLMDPKVRKYAKRVFTDVQSVKRKGGKNWFKNKKNKRTKRR